MRSFVLITLAAACSALFAGSALAQDYALVDRLADKVVQKYTYASCQDLADERRHRPTGDRAEMEEHAIRVMRNNPQMRREFIERVAAPIANRLFECGFIP
nr:hypothetical protein [uncultured Rhodopila sp.]